MSKNFRRIIGAALIACGLAVLLVYSLNLPSKDATRAQFLEWMRTSAITSASIKPTVYGGIYSIEGQRRDRNAVAEFSITTPLDAEQLKVLVEKPSVTIDVPGHSVKAQLLNVVPTVIIGGLVITLLVYQLSIGKSKRNHRVRERPTTRFKDVAGVEEAKAEVQEIVDFLKNPDKYKHLGGKLPKGILLIGPPGTGKTMLAKAIAGEAEANFFSAHGSDFNEIFVGVGAKRIRELFRLAHKHKPAIIFIDEIDCLGKKRKLDGHGELQQTNNALLAAMDGFEGSESIVVIGATNRPEDLDEALVRPGRFDRKVHVPLPDMKGRRAILEAHTELRPIKNKEAVLDMLAQTTAEMSGADLANVINEAAILGAQRGLNEITLAEFEDSRDKVRFGKERKSMVLKSREREMVAYHEAGHAIINLRTSELPPLYKVSIIPRGQALGVTTLLPNEDQNIHNKRFLLENLVVLMGGRAAERVFYGVTTNGAHGDLDSAKRLARHMIHDWGMGEKLYYQPERSDAETEINRILESADREALSIIERERDNTRKLAEALLQNETLTREEVLHLVYEGKQPEPTVNLALN
jgi:cell division protease FtsH